MFSWLPNILGIVISAVVTIAVARYYFRYSFQKRLTVYIYNAAAALSVDSSIRSSTTVHYKDIKVNEIFRIQFLIQNEGSPTIRDYKKPLSFSTRPLDRHPRLLDVKVVRGSRPVAVNTRTNTDGSTRTEFDFDLLNKGDFFLVECLFDGKIGQPALNFEITADGLPDIIPSRSGWLREVDKPDKLAWLGYLGVALFGAFLLAFLAYKSLSNPPSVFGLRNWWAVALPVAMLFLIMFGVAFIAMIKDAIFRIGRRRRRRLHLPGDS